jgi:hypothetical protein
MRQVFGGGSDSIGDKKTGPWWISLMAIPARRFYLVARAVRVCGAGDLNIRDFACRRLLALVRNGSDKARPRMLNARVSNVINWAVVAGCVQADASDRIG